MNKQDALNKAAEALDESSIHSLFRDLCNDSDTDIADATINLIGEVETAKRTGKIPKFLIGAESAHLWDRHILGFLWVVMAWCEFHKSSWINAKAERWIDAEEENGFED